MEERQIAPHGRTSNKLLLMEERQIAFHGRTAYLHKEDGIMNASQSRRNFVNF